MRKFQYLGCSGATASNILKDQVELLKDPQMVTLSAGGNDAMLSNVLNSCVFQWFTSILNDCDKTLQRAKDTNNGETFSKDLTALANGIQGKMSHPHRRIYWVAYAKFFGEIRPTPFLACGR